MEQERPYTETEPETAAETAETVTFTGDGESHFLRNDGPEPLEFLALVLNLPAQA